MKQVALYDAKNTLSALIAEVEASGEDIIITRHGKPVVRLAAVTKVSTEEERKTLGQMLLENLDKQARMRPPGLKPLTWEELKADMDEDR